MRPADDVYRFRLGFFVDHLKWEACRKPNGRECETKDANAFSRAAFGAVAQVVDALGLEGLLVQTYPIIVERLMDMGWDVEPLALPALYDGAMLMPIYARPTADTVSVGRAAGELSGIGLRLPEIAQHEPATARADRLVA